MISRNSLSRWLWHPALTRFTGVVAALLFLQAGYSQCVSGANVGTIVPTGTYQSLAVAAGGPDYVTFNSTTGSVYDFSLCSADGGTAGGDDSYLTLADNTGAALLTADDNCDGAASKMTWTATGTGTFRLYISNFVCDPRPVPYTLRYRVTAGGGTNDFCGSAVPVTCGTTFSGSTVGSVTSANPGCFSSQANHPGRWYSVTGDGGQFTASLCGSSYDTQIAVFTGGCGALTCVAGNDDDCGLQSSTTWATTNGTPYLIFVHGYNGATGSFTFSLTCVAACTPAITNDDCAGALPVTINSGACVSVQNGNNNCATPPATNPSCFSIFATPLDVWYTFTTGASTTQLAMTITYGTATQLGYALYTGACGGLTQTACNYGFGGYVSGSVEVLNVNPSTTYFLQILGPTANRGSFTLCLTQPIPSCTTYLAPADGGTVGGNPVGLSWNSAQFATGYDVYVDQSNPPTTLVSSNQAGTTYNYVPTNPTAGQVYYWSIVPRNAGGTAVNAPCAVSSFTLGAPPCPILASPASAATIEASTGTTLTWNTSLGATTYSVYMDNNPTPTTPLSLNQAGVSVATGVLTPNLTYYWMVTATGPYGTSSGCVARNFTTNPPTCTTLISPANGGSSCSGAGTTLSWNPIEGATGYDVYFNSGGVASTQVGFNQAGTTFSAGVLANGGYAWRVVPRNTNGTATGCATWTFNVIASPVGDTFATAIDITSLPHSSGPHDNDVANCFTNNFGQGAADKIFKITTSPCTTTLSIGICGNGDSYLYLVAADQTTVIAQDDDSEPVGCANGLNSSLTNIAVTPNTLYYIVMDGFSTNTITGVTLTVSANCFCTAPTAQVSSINDNCGANTFTMSVLTNTTGSTATANIVYTVNGGSPVTVTGATAGSTTTIPAVGSFPTTATIVVSVQTSDGFCSVNLGDYASSCPINYTCGPTPITVNYCYKNNDVKAWSFHSNSAGTTLTLSFVSGMMQAGDVIRAYSGTNNLGAPIASLTGSFADLTNATGSSTGQNLYLEVQSDASGSCFDGHPDASAWEFEVGCTNTTCTQAQGSVTINANCSTIQVEVLDAGDLGSTTLQYTVIGNSAQTWPTPLSSGDIVTVGPFVTGQSVQLILLHPTEPNCNKNLGTFLIPAQPTPVTVTATATPATICPGGNSQLLVTATTPSTAAQYAFAASTGAALDPMVGAVNIISGSGIDDTQSGITNIGFTFKYENTNYTTFSASSNGIARLGAAVGTAYDNTSAFQTAQLSPLWDDHSTSTNAVRTVLVGTSPNQIRIIDFNLNISFGTAANFQLWLYEGTNVIEFRYGTTTASTSSAFIGIAGNPISNFQSVTPPSSVSTAVRNNSVTGWPGNGQMYRFSPPSVAMSSIVWTPSTFLNNPNIANPLASGVSATTPYHVTFTAAGCPRAADVTVTVNSPISSGTVTPASPTVCSGQTVTLTGTATSGVAPYTYAWTKPDNTSGGTAQTTTAGMAGTWTCRITDACGVFFDATTTMTVNPTPTSVPSNNGPLCAGQVLNLTGASNIATGWSWTGPGGYTSTSQSPSRGASTLAMAGTYTLTTSTALCNSLPATTIVAVNESPVMGAVTATPPVVCSGNNSQLSSVATMSGVYTLAPIAHAPVSGTGIAGPAGDDVTSASITLPFTFNFYGAPYTNVFISTNGYIMLGTNGGAGCCSGQVFPSATTPNNVIALGWEDFNTGSGGNIDYFSLTAPNRFVVRWNGVARYQGSSIPGAAMTGEIILYQTGVIELHATSITTGPADLTTMGIENSTGTQAVVVAGRNSTNWSATNEGWRFTPNLISYSWSPTTFLSDPAIANPMANGVTATTAYTVTATNVPTGCFATGNVTVTLNTTDTDNDGVIDCLDNCPTAPGQIGSFCDDGNPNTVLTQLDDNCLCVGGQACTNNLTLEMRTDLNPGQIHWELRDKTNDVLVQAGPTQFGPGGYPAPNSVFTETTCLPDGCYYLRVTDSGGDGITGGGYVLRTAGSPGTRIIDNQGNFSSGSVSAIANNGEFCLPLGPAKTIFTSCDKLDWVTGDYIVCTPIASVSAQFGGAFASTSGYEFWFYNPNGGYSFRRFRDHNTSDGFAPADASRACHAKINNWAVANQIPANVLMNVKVRTRIAGVNGTWGAACKFKIDPVRAACPLTKLNDIPGSSTFSCNVTRHYGTGNYVYAIPVTGATAYQFRFRIDGENFVTIRNSNNYICQLNWNVLPLQNGKTYQVEVRAMKGGVWCVDTSTPAPGPNYTPWGSVCDLTICNACPVNGGNQNMLEEDGTTVGLRMYPNPNRGDQLYVQLDAVEEGVNTVSVDIYDTYGRRVSARTIAVQGGFVNTVLDLDGDMASGMYMVNVIAGSQQYSERLVIQK